MMFSPDGRTLVTQGTDGTSVLWDLTDLNQLRGHPMRRACSITGRGLSRDQWARYIPYSPGLPYQETCPT
jgi:WD40 repeat protein